MRLQQRLANTLRAGSLVTVVQDYDEVLARDECVLGSKIFPPVEMFTGEKEEVMERLTKLSNSYNGETLILIDFLSIYGDNPVSVRLIRNICSQELSESRPKATRLVLLEHPGTKIPPILSGDVEIISPELPSVTELTEELVSFTKSSNLTIPGNGEMKYALASACAGLARHEASRLFGRCYVENKTLLPDWLRKEKAKRVAQRLGGALTFESTDAADVGGLDLLQKWLLSRKSAFESQKALDWGLPRPKGLLALGVPGGGKSLTARMIARTWGVPLLRFDVGKVFGSLVGQSESQMRAAIEAAEACSPCVLWVDEIEKALASGGLDGGTSTRVMGSMLTWLQEKKSPVFVFATANRISALPPELLRKGRFDEIFYVGLPTEKERQQIIGIHLKRRNRELNQEDINKLAGISKGFTGAELEQVVIEGLFDAYNDGARDLKHEDVASAIQNTTPLAETMKEEIKQIEVWASTRARPASSRDVVATLQSPNTPGEIEGTIAPRRSWMN